MIQYDPSPPKGQQPTASGIKSQVMGWYNRSNPEERIAPQWPLDLLWGLLSLIIPMAVALSQ